MNQIYLRELELQSSFIKPRRQISSGLFYTNNKELKAKGNGIILYQFGIKLIMNKN